MNISNELKAKLRNARSEEEVKVLLGGQASKEEVSRAWQEIEHHRPAEGLEAVDDSELAAVSGGADRDFLTQGCAASVEYGSFCWSDDSCVHWDVTYDNEQYACTIGYKNHDWGPLRSSRYGNNGGQQSEATNYYRICNRCGKQVGCTQYGEIKL